MNPLNNSVNKDDGEVLSVSHPLGTQFCSFFSLDIQKTLLEIVIFLTQDLKELTADNKKKDDELAKLGIAAKVSDTS